MSEITDKYKKKYIICRITSALFVVLPIIIYTILGFVQGTVRTKLVLGMCLLTTLVFVGINIIAKHRIRSTIWIMLIGLYCACSNIVPLLIIIAVTTIVDEFILEPLYKKYKNKYNINIEIDERMEE